MKNLTDLLVQFLHQIFQYYSVLNMSSGSTGWIKPPIVIKIIYIQSLP